MADDNSNTPLQLGTRVRTLTSGMRDLFRRNYYDPPNIEIIPAGATGRVVSTHWVGGETLYDVRLEAIETNIQKTRSEWVEIIDNDAPIEGRLIHVADQPIADDIWQFRELYPELDIFHRLIEKTEVYQNEDGLYCLRWNAEYQAIIDRLKAEADAS